MQKDYFKVSKLDSIVFEENSDIISQLDSRRSSRYIFEKKLIQEQPVQVDICNSKAELKDGRLTIKIGSANFECFFKKGSSNQLFIILGGARTENGGRKRAIPRFNRWSWYSNTEASWLSIEDPMYYLNDEVLVGWFYGTKKENFRTYLIEIAKFFAKKIGINNEDIVFFGSSAGGTAALHAANLLSGSTGVSINGQYNFEYNRKDILDFKNKLGIDLHETDKFQRNDVVKWFSNKESKFLIIGNIRSRWDREDHIKYLSRKLNTKFRLGLNCFDNFVIWLYEANGYLNNAHSSFEDRNLFKTIEFLVTAIKEKLTISNFQDLYLLFNEFWFEKYEFDQKLLSHESLEEYNLIYQNKDIKIHSKDDKYVNFDVPIELIKGKEYQIEIEMDLKHSTTSKLTIGVFDWTNRKFVIRESFDNKENLIISLKLRDANPKCRLLIFPGLHGQCNGEVLFINSLKIYSK